MKKPFFFILLGAFSFPIFPALTESEELSGNKQSKTGGICVSIIGILKNEIGKTKNKTKLGILQGGLKYADEVCNAGGFRI
ncbi:MAG: hypothetical protein HY796_11990 [Elusimicrobia bacterium]|nr:hypothetical protein [Elusimicrobiota bacterium]